MNFILIGNDENVALFVAEAIARSHRILAVLLEPADAPMTSLHATAISEIDQIWQVGGVDAIIVGGPPDKREERIRQILRREPIDLIVTHPLSHRPDIYYEMALAESESRTAILTLVVETAHPALERIASILASELGPVRWFEMSAAFSSRELDRDMVAAGWGWVRKLVGEIASVSATSDDAELAACRQLSASVRSQSGILGTCRWSRGADDAWRLQLDAERGTIECGLSRFDKAAELTITPAGGTLHTEKVEPASIGQVWFDQWLAMKQQGAHGHGASLADATRSIEIASAVVRSLDSRREVTLTYGHVSEQAAFKSVMTMFGCSLVWWLILVAILIASGVPYIEYVIIPLLSVFLLLQLFGFVYKKPEASSAASD